MDGCVYLDGGWEDGASREAVRAPWEGSEVGVVGLADEAQIERAVAFAHGAVRSLKTFGTHARRALLVEIARRIASEHEALAGLISREAGKPIDLARIEVTRAVETFTLAAEECSRLGGEVLALDRTAGSEGTWGAWMRVPAGAVLAITPFNFPLNLVAHKLAPAFALGAPVVLKPAPQTPLTALALARIVHDAGAPRGLLAVVPTSNALAQRMVEDARFAVLSFTGSADVGWRLKAIGGRKRTLLELGGNAALVVAPDGDEARALDRAVGAAFGYAGQSCIKVQRVFVHEARVSDVAEVLAERARAVGVRDPMLNGTVCGPVIDTRSGDRIRAWIDEAVASGARVVAGGDVIGNRVAPTVVTGASEGVKLVDEEVFGPVVTVHGYDRVSDAFAAIERGRYGLQAGLFTYDTRVIREAFSMLSVGALIVGDVPTVRYEAMPYGGVKDSGLGREGVRYAIDELSDKKLLVMRA